MLTVALLLAILSSVSNIASGIEVYPLITDPNHQPGFGGGLNMFADPPAFFLDDTAVVNGNNIAVYSMDGIPPFNGAGFSLAVSNGCGGRSRLHHLEYKQI